MSTGGVTPLISYDENIPPYGVTESTPLHEDDKKKVSGSIYLVVLTTFISSIYFTIVLPSLWFYLEELDTGYSKEVLLGVTNSVYSIGQFIGSPLFGWLSNRWPTKKVLIVTLWLMFAGSILYSLAAIFPTGITRLATVVLARFIVGLGGGNVAVCRAYASHASTLENRRTVMTYISAAQTLGFAFGPAVMAGLSLMGSGKVTILYLLIDQNTLAGYGSAVLALLNIALLFYVNFKEVHADDHNSLSGVDTSLSFKEKGVIMTTVFMFFVTVGVFSVFETIGAEMMDSYYGWEQTKAGIMFILASLVSMVSFVLVTRPFAKKLDERMILILWGFIPMTCSLFLIATWEGLQDQPWLWQFFLGVVILSFSYPTAMLFVFTIFSKLLHPQSQGTKMGWLTSSGSLARIIGPLWASNAFQWGGGTLLFLSTACTVLLATAVCIGFYPYLVPHPAQLEEEKKIGTIQ